MPGILSSPFLLKISSVLPLHLIIPSIVHSPASFNMVAFSKIIPALVAATLASAASHDTRAKLTKPVLNQNIDYLKDGLNKHLTETKFKKSQWQSGWIPQACKNLASDTKTQPQDFEIWDVTYDDVNANIFSFMTSDLTCIVR